MIYPIYLYDDSKLRNISAPISEKYPQLDRLIADMFETMHKAKGVGLSAIQIGIPIRLFVVEAHLEEENFDFREVFINPVIEEYGEEEISSPEGCLSIPGLTAVVSRPDKIRITYYNKKWEKITTHLRGWKSRIVQHEMDHLDGKLYVDSLTGMWKSLLENPLQFIAEGRIKPNYLTK